MKTKDFVEKYNLNLGWNNKHQNGFIQDITSELLAMLEYNKAANNIKGFDNAVRVIKMKWDGISNKTPHGLPEKLWNYYYATTISKMKVELCPREVEIRKKQQEERRKEREHYKRMREEEERMLFGDASDFYERIALLLLSLNSKPTESFRYLNLSDNATTEDIKRSYRQMSQTAHPDKGGSQEDFIKLTEHKNNCLKWVSKTVTIK